MKTEKLIAVLKELATAVATVEPENCSDIAADYIRDGLHAVADAIDGLTAELKQQRQGR